MSELESKATLSTVYEPLSVERRIYDFWEQGGFFRAGQVEGRPTFSVVMPPPNVTGSLHIGHALDNTLQDVVTRYKRMSGHDVLWLPGTDHAGIATQTRVEKNLREATGQSRHDLGREAFIERVWEWKKLYGDTITNQVRRLGASCDWTRERFTMDEGLSQAVREVFVRLFEKGLIYRGNRIINWCPRCGTALSDIEVEHADVPSSLYHVRYPLSDGQGSVVVATTRPETMFGDVAVAVHPQDGRYQDLVGKTLRLPLTYREIPIIADEYVDPEFGTGCVKITPAHDPNDFEVGLRHNLAMPQCIDADGKLNELAGKYAGFSREEARALVVADLETEGYLRQADSISHAVGHCSRCETVVEPFLSEQWFVRMEQLAKPALQGVASGELHFVPERFEKVFVHWLEGVRDWCISRQLWWGHRIPAWYCADCGEVTVAREDVTQCGHCGGVNVKQDEDVLDTWFSSALWPFSTMGWPQETADLQKYYPTSALMTGYDILFFWVARMVFTGLEFTGKMPFQDVILHGLIRAADGRKMSKSLGNGVDPIEVIDQYGADALRFMLATGSSPGNDQRFHFERVESARNFINKVWNASRFVLMNLEVGYVPAVLDRNNLQIADQWILHRLNETIEEATRHLNRYDFGEAGRTLYDFAWDDFCDWYIEFSKLSLYGQNEDSKHQTQAVLTHVLESLLRLLHPFIPFVTEEIWQHLPIDGPALATASWPIALSANENSAAVKQMSVVMDAIRGVRNVRAERGVAPSKPIAMLIRSQDQATATLLESVRPYLVRFCNLSSLLIGLEVLIPDQVVTVVVSGAEVFLPLADLVDLAAEKERMEKERTRLESEVTRVRQKLSNGQFISKAPASVVAEERAKEQDYLAKLKVVEERLRSL